MSAQRRASSLSNARFRPFASILSSPMTTIQQLVSRFQGASPSDTSTSLISARLSVPWSQSQSHSPRLLLSTPARVSIQQPMALASTSTLVSPPPSYPGSMALPSPPFAPPNTTTYAASPPAPIHSPETPPGYHGDCSASIDSLVSESPEPVISTATAGTSQMLPVRSPTHASSDAIPHRHFLGTICLCNQFESTPTETSEKERTEGGVGAGYKEEAEERAQLGTNKRSGEKSKEKAVKGKGKELGPRHETTNDSFTDDRSGLSCTCPKWYLNCVSRHMSKCINWIDTLSSLAESGDILDLSTSSGPSQPSLAALVAMHFEVPLDLAVAPCVDTIHLYEFAGNIEGGRIKYTPPLPGQASYNTWFYLPVKDWYQTQNGCRGIGDIDIIPHPVGRGFMYFVFCEVPGEPLQYYWAGYELGESHPLHLNYYLYHFDNHAPMWIGQGNQPEGPYDVRPRILDKY